MGSKSKTVAPSMYVHARVVMKCALLDRGKYIVYNPTCRIE
jgi:hypothetical protein